MTETAFSKTFESLQPEVEQRINELFELARSGGSQCAGAIPAELAAYLVWHCSEHERAEFLAILLGGIADFVAARDGGGQVH